MLGKSFTSPVLTSQPSSRCYISPLDFATSASNVKLLKLNFSRGIAPKKWKLCSTTETQTLTLGEDERKTWEATREALTSFEFTTEEKDKILGKAFGHVHSPYWSEGREKEVPSHEIVNKTLEYLRSLGLSDDDLGKLLKKFPEVLGCSLDEEVRNNVRVLEETWGIKGKSLRSLLLRNPKVLGYNVDCKGDCVAKCTRCWVRF